MRNIEKQTVHDNIVAKSQVSAKSKEKNADAKIQKISETYFQIYQEA